MNWNLKLKNLKIILPILFYQPFLAYSEPKNGIEIYKWKNVNKNVCSKKPDIIFK